MIPPVGSMWCVALNLDVSIWPHRDPLEDWTLEEPIKKLSMGETFVILDNYFERIKVISGSTVGYIKAGWWWKSNDDVFARVA